MKNKTQSQIDKLEKKLIKLKENLKEEQSKTEWIEIPELGISVEIEVHDKDKSWNELKLNEREDDLLTVEQCIWLANSEYAKQLKMDGSSSNDDFFIKQPFKLNKNNNYVARFNAGSYGAYLSCDGGPSGSRASLGVRFCKQISTKRKR